MAAYRTQACIARRSSYLTKRCRLAAVCLASTLLMWMGCEKKDPPPSDVVAYRVIFNFHDGSGNTVIQNVRAGEKANRPKPPTRERHEFTNWYAGAALNTVFNFDNPIERDTTLYAGWEKTAFVVAFDLMGGTLSEKDTMQIVQKGQPVSPPTAFPTKERHWFTGWYGERKGNERFDFDAPLHADTTVYAGYVVANFDATAYTGTDTVGIALRDALHKGPLLTLHIPAYDTVAVVALAQLGKPLSTLRRVSLHDGNALLNGEDLTGVIPQPGDRFNLKIAVTVNGVEVSKFFAYTYNPSHIRTWQDLQGMRADLTGSYTLMGDIVLPDGYNFAPIKGPHARNNEAHRFSGVLNGNGYVVHNLYIDRFVEDYVGLVGYNAGTVKNIGVETAPKGIAGNIVGGLTGQNDGVVIGYVKGAVLCGSDNAMAGGIAGFNQGVIVGYSSGRVGAASGQAFMGGAVGLNDGDMIGYSAAKVEEAYEATPGALLQLGGLVGFSDPESVQLGYATGKVIGAQAGGLIGGSPFTVRIEGYARGDVVRRQGAGDAADFGLLIGTLQPLEDSDKNTPEIGGYHSSDPDESRRLEADGTASTYTPSSNVEDGTAIDARTAEQRAYTSLAFGSQQGQWTYTAGQWPTINLYDRLPDGSVDPDGGNAFATSQDPAITPKDFTVFESLKQPTAP